MLFPMESWIPMVGKASIEDRKIFDSGLASRIACQGSKTNAKPAYYDNWYVLGPTWTSRCEVKERAVLAEC